MVKTKKRQCDTKPVRSTTNAVLLKPSRKKNSRKKQIRNNYVQDKIRQSMKELGKAETVTGIETQNPVQLQNYDHCLPEGDEIPSVPKSILPKYEKRRLWRKCLKEARELQKAYLASAVSKAKGLASKSVGGKSTSKQSTKQVKTNKEHLGQKKKEVSNGKTIGKRQKSKKKVKRLQPSLNKQNVIKTMKVEQSLTQAFSLSKPKTNGFPLQNVVPDANNTNKVDISLPDADQSDSDYDPDYNSNADPNEDQISEIEMSFEGDAQQDTVQEVISDNDSELDPDYHPDQYTAQEVVFENESSSEDDPDYVPEQNTTQEVVFENESNSEDDPDYYLDQDTVQEEVFVNETGTKSDLDFDFVQKEVFANDSNSESDSDYSPEQDIDSENDHPSDYIPTTNGFEVCDLETEQPVGQYALVRRDEERNYEDEVEDDSDSDFSVGSDAEEIVFNEGWQQQQPFSSEEDSMASMSVSQMQDAYREFVENYMRDHENVQVHQAVNDEDDSSDDSCPELVPICPTNGVSAVDAALSESSFGTEYSCEHSDCCGYSEDGDGETDEEEEAEEEEDEEWQNVGESDDDVEIEESENSSGEAYSDLEVDDFSDYTEDVSEDNMDEEYGGAFSYVDNEKFENTEDESTFEDPHFFESDRPPLIISAGQSSKNSWSKFPLDLNQSVGSFGHDTTIQNIVRQVRLNNPRPVEMSILNEENGETSDLDESETTVEETLNDEAEEQTSSAPEAFETIETLDNTVNEDDQNDQEAAVHQEYQNEYDDLETSTTSTANHNRPRFYNSLNSRQVLLVLKSELHFHGILKVTLLAGNARVYGFSLRTNQPVTAFSSRGHSFVSIQPMQPANAENATQKAAYLDTVQSILTSMESDFISHDIFSAIECFDPSNDVLLLLEPAARQLPGLNMIQKYMRQLVFPNVNSFNKRGAYYSSEFILRTKFFLLPRTKLHVNPQWSSVPLGATSRTLVLGGKGVGKSTFVRFAANSCVQRYGRVLLIDLDIGQPEIFVPQTISATLLADPLLGPGFLQNQKPDYALLFGEINVTVSPLKYLRCVLKLLQHCASNADYSNVPWIINTMGYNKGFGPELMAAVLRTFSGCTDVVQIQSQRQLDNFDQIMNFGVVNEYRFNFFHSELLAAEKLEPVKYQTHVVRSLARKFGDRTNDWDMSAKDTRFAIVLSHLGALLRDGGEWITDVKPMCASLDDLKVITSEEVSPDQYLRLLNGNLVYLCHQNPLDTSDAHVECLGIGIVRAVDQDTNKIYLLPALTNLAKLAATNALAVCTTPLPSSLITNHNRRVTGRVPYVYSTDDFIGSKQVVRISYRPVFTPQKV